MEQCSRFKCCKTAQFPVISVFAVKGREDVTIHIRDRGGGIPRRLIGSIFEYLYTTASPVMTSSHEVQVCGSG
jgi:C4-dicarboxylate-specific signal transduction histidine kinase